MAANRVFQYFDLQSERRGAKAAEAHGADEEKRLPIIPQYIALVIGIVVEPFLRDYVVTGSWSWATGAIIGRAVFGLLIGLAVFPAVYKNGFDPESPGFVQLCAIFAAGFGWQSLIQVGGQLTGVP